MPHKWLTVPLLQVTENNGVLTIAVDQPTTQSKEGGEQEKEKDKDKDEEKEIIHRCITNVFTQLMLLVLVAYYQSLFMCNYPRVNSRAHCPRHVCASCAGRSVPRTLSHAPFACHQLLI